MSGVYLRRLQDPFVRLGRSHSPACLSSANNERRMPRHSLAFDTVWETPLNAL
jgi:hypothetical protein